MAKTIPKGKVMACCR